MSAFKNLMNLILTLGFIVLLSYFSYEFCNWYGCNSWSYLLRSDLICNTCIDISYHIKNHQLSIYGGIFTLVSYHLKNLINKATSLSDKYIFEDYDLARGEKSPKSLKPK
tara:strand:+ start:5339 stop:5668 length:330 start_codon:yes stop_codon:yes gene_type:complete